MTSLRQFEANRRNAARSTGPRTEEGKQASRRNALRHGLTAETVIEGLEDSEDYRGFEAAIIADYDAQTAVERELVLRLASLLWRLRRIISIETDLLQSGPRFAAPAWMRSSAQADLMSSRALPQANPKTASTSSDQNRTQKNATTSVPSRGAYRRGRLHTAFFGSGISIMARLIG
jgi:hypothetical protein